MALRDRLGREGHPCRIGVGERDGATARSGGPEGLPRIVFGIVQGVARVGYPWPHRFTVIAAMSASASNPPEPSILVSSSRMWNSKSANDVS